MFIGHFAVGFAAKRVAPRLPLWTAFVACQFLDLIWPVLVIVGIERVAVDSSATAFTPLDFSYYPWSHSLLMALGWSVLACLTTWLAFASRRSALVVGGLVASHWVLDWITHRPDLPLSPASEARVGLGLWHFSIGTLFVELALFGLGVWLYARSTRPLSRRRRWILRSLVVFLLAVYGASAFGPAPPSDASPAMLAGPALAMWLLVLWAAWLERWPLRRPPEHA